MTSFGMSAGFSGSSATRTIGGVYGARILYEYTVTIRPGQYHSIGTAEIDETLMILLTITVLKNSSFPGGTESRISPDFALQSPDCECISSSNASNRL